MLTLVRTRACIISDFGFSKLRVPQPSRLSYLFCFTRGGRDGCNLLLAWTLIVDAINLGSVNLRLYEHISHPHMKRNACHNVNLAGSGKLNYTRSASHRGFELYHYGLLGERLMFGLNNH